MADVLLIIDVQQELTDALDPERRAEFFGTLVPLLERARGAGVPVVYVRDASVSPGTPGWEIPREIAPRPGEPIIDKHFGDAFEETPLAEVLTGLGIDRVIAAGMQTDFCVNATVRGAGDHGYAVTLVEDGHATYASEGRSEAEIRADMHREVAARGVRLVPAVELFSSVASA